MIVFIPKETRNSETRVAASPDTVKKLVGLGADVLVQKGAGIASRLSDEAFKNAGARIVGEKDAASADVVLKVLRPSPAEARKLKKGTLVIATMDPYGNES